MNSVILPIQNDFLRRFYRLATINVLSNIIVPLSGAVSMAFLGHLSAIHYLAGTALATPLFNFIYFVLSFLRMGTTGVTAQAVGSDDREETIRVGLRNGLIALGLGGIILLLQYPLELAWFNHGMSATLEVKTSGIDYFNTRIWGAPAVLLNSVLIGWFLGREKSGFVLLMSLLCNAANIGLDYLFIVGWHWSSAGAGLAQALSQYLTLLLGITLASRELVWKEIYSAAKKLWNVSAFRATFALNGNIFLRSLSNMTVIVLFFGLSSAMGTTTLTENALLSQVLLLSIYLFEGIGFATETLIGNLQGQKSEDLFMPVLRVALLTSLLAGLSIAATCVLFTKQVFVLFTNHSDILEMLNLHVPWLFWLLAATSISALLDSYFAGLARGEALRNASIAGIIFGFTPIAVTAWYLHSNHILWLSLTMFMTVKAIILTAQLLSSNSSKSQQIEENIHSSI